MEIFRGRVLLALAVASLLAACAGPDTEIKKKETSEGYYKLGVAYLSGGDFHRAVVELTKAIELNPNDPNYHNALGLAYFSDRKIDEAISEFEKAVQLDPKLSEANNNLGAAYAQKRKWPEAILAFRRALANPLYATPERAYFNLGSIYFQQGKVKEAVDEFKRALDISPDYSEAHYFLGLIYDRQDKTDLAIEEFKRAIKTSPELVVVHQGLALAYYTKMGKLGRGSKEYQELKALSAASFRRVIELAPTGPLAEEAQRYLKQLD
ncbi:MAG: tetratricopeptide repeat protein [candidate division NC10 bacterium]|nr:tetratricopeptide repeat protein [candidate division NC10 bacterium]